MKKILFLSLIIPFLAKAQIGEVSITGGMSFLATENQSVRNAPFGGGGSLRMSAGKNSGIFSMSLGYDLNQQIEHPQISRLGLQSLKTSIGAGGYALIGRNDNILFKALAEMVYWNSSLPTQQGFAWEGISYDPNDIKGHSLGLQVHVGLSIPFGRESAFAFNVNAYAGGILRRQASYKYTSQVSGCCGGNQSQLVRRKFSSDPFSLPRAIIGVEMGISIFLRPKEPSWSQTTYYDPYTDQQTQTTSPNSGSIGDPPPGGAISR